MPKPKLGLIALLAALATGLTLASGLLRFRKKKPIRLYEWGC
jgi:hypothetical protein